MVKQSPSPQTQDPTTTQTTTTSATPTANPEASAAASQSVTNTSQPTNTTNTSETHSVTINSQETVFTGFIRALAVQNSVISSELVVSELNNIHDLILGVKTGSAEKQLISKAERSYKIASDSLYDLIHLHRDQEESKFNKDITQDGRLSFQPPIVYLKDTNGHKIISSANSPILTFEFIMIRSINYGANVSKSELSPHYNISFDPAKDSYTPADVVHSFNYRFSNGTEIQKSILVPDPKDKNKLKKALNTFAIEILSKEKGKINDIIKNAFRLNEDECNTLKDTAPKHQIIVCNGLNRATDPDSTMKFFICRETFKLAKNPELCGKTDFLEENIDF